MKKRTIKILGVVLISLIGLIIIFAKVKRVTPLSWGPKKVNQPMFSNKAINGYDAVAYFTKNQAIEGDDMYAYDWKDARWLFSSEDNKKLFSESPDKYAPQYGGYCAFAVGKGFTANVDPNAFEIMEGKLYFFADDGIKADWMSSVQENLKISQNNWK